LHYSIDVVDCGGKGSWLYIEAVYWLRCKCLYVSLCVMKNELPGGGGGVGPAPHILSL